MEQNEYELFVEQLYNTVFSLETAIYTPSDVNVNHLTSLAPLAGEGKVKTIDLNYKYLKDTDKRSIIVTKSLMLTHDDRCNLLTYIIGILQDDNTVDANLVDTICRLKRMEKQIALSTKTLL